MAELANEVASDLGLGLHSRRADRDPVAARSIAHAIDWSPHEFDHAQRHLSIARCLSNRYPAALALRRLIRAAINASARLGGPACLSCPAPLQDPAGCYRVVLYCDQPVIERLTEAGDWIRVESERITLKPPPGA